MNRQVIVYAVTIIALVFSAVTWAYAETPFTANVEVYSENVTIPLQHPLVSKECKYHPDDPRVWTECLFLGPAINKSGYTGEQFTVPSGNYEWNDETNTYDPTPEFEAEAIADCKADLTCPSGNYQYPDGTIVDFDEDIEEPPEDLPPEGVYRCGYDIALYQDGSQFDVPIEIWIDLDGNKNVRLVKDYSLVSDKHTTIDELAVDACFAQWSLEIREHIVGPEGTTITKVPNSEDKQINHQDFAFGIPPITQALVNTEANKDTPANISIRNLICNGNYEKFYKDSFIDPVTGQGCTTEPLKGADPPEAKQVIPDWMQDDIDQYNLDGGKQMAKDKKTADLNREIANLVKQLRLYK